MSDIFSKFIQSASNNVQNKFHYRCFIEYNLSFQKIKVNLSLNFWHKIFNLSGGYRPCRICRIHTLPAGQLITNKVNTHSQQASRSNLQVAGSVYINMNCIMSLFFPLLFIWIICESSRLIHVLWHKQNIAHFLFVSCLLISVTAGDT